MVKLGVYEAWFDGEVIVPGDTLKERLANLEAWGYQGIQLQGPTMELGLPVIKEALANSNIELCIFGGDGQLLVAEEELRQAGVERIKEELHQAAELGAVGSIIVPISGRPQIAPPAPPRTVEELEREILIQELAQIAPTAEETGALLLLEPLNRYETHFLNRLEQGVEICRAVGSPGIKIMADFFHMNIEEADIAQAIKEAGNYIAYVHLADSNRCQPGAGHLDFRPGLAALKQVGYHGFMTLECRILGDDKGTALAESARYIREIWAQV